MYVNISIIYLIAIKYLIIFKLFFIRFKGVFRVFKGRMVFFSVSH